MILQMKVAAELHLPAGSTSAEQFMFSRTTGTANAVPFRGLQRAHLPFAFDNAKPVRPSRAVGRA